MAQEVLEKHLTENEETGPVLNLLALALYQQGFLKKSASRLKKACEIKKEPEYFINLSMTLNELGRYQEGRTAYEQALYWKERLEKQKWQEELAQKHFSAGEIYFKTEQFESALQEYLKVLKLAPNNVEGHIKLARTLWNLRRKQEAKKHLNNVITRFPHQAEAEFLMTHWYFEEKQMDQTNNSPQAD